MSVEVEESTNEENEGIFKKGDELLQAIQDSYKDGSHEKLVELINKDCDGTLGGYIIHNLDPQLERKVPYNNFYR